MNLKIETVSSALEELADAYGAPRHIEDKEHMGRVIGLYHRELSKQFTDEQFKDALTIAWQQARRFPVVADFHRGFDAPDNGNTPTMAQIGLV